MIMGGSVCPSDWAFGSPAGELSETAVVNSRNRLASLLWALVWCFGEKRILPPVCSSAQCGAVAEKYPRCLEALV